MKNERDRMDHLEVEMLSLRWAVENTEMGSKILEEIYRYTILIKIKRRRCLLVLIHGLQSMKTFRQKN